MPRFTLPQHWRSRPVAATMVGVGVALVIGGSLVGASLVGGSPASDREAGAAVQTTPLAAQPPAGIAPPGFASAANTGPAAAGFHPTLKYTGPLTVTVAGTIIENRIVPAGLRIEADDVTIRGNIIAGPTEESWDQAAIHVNGRRVRIVDNEIRGNSATDWRQTPVSGAKLVGDDVVFEGNNMHRISGDGVSIYGANARIVGNWVHDFVDREVVHFDGVHYPGDDTTAPGLLRDNTVTMWVPHSGMTAALAFPDIASKIVVDHNLIAGGNYAIMGGGAGIRITNNLFWTRFSEHVGFYGTHAHLGEAGSVTWANNSYTADGHTVGLPVEY